MKFLVTQEAWAMAGFGGSPKPQTMAEKIKSGPLEGCVMLSDPDTVGNEVITDRALRRFAVALGVDPDGLVPA